jgi:hypothetical protein
MDSAVGLHAQNKLLAREIQVSHCCVSVVELEVAHAQDA